MWLWLCVLVVASAHLTVTEEKLNTTPQVNTTFTPAVVAEPKNYKFEIMVGIVGLIFLANFISGKKKNANMAKEWIMNQLHVLNAQLEHFGVGELQNKNGPYLEYIFSIGKPAIIHSTSLDLVEPISSTFMVPLS